MRQREMKVPRAAPRSTATASLCTTAGFWEIGGGAISLLARAVHARPAAASDVDADGAADVDADVDAGVTAADADADGDAAVAADLDGAVAIPSDGGSTDDGGGSASGGGGASGDAGVAASDAGRDGGGGAAFVNPSPNYPDDGCSVVTFPGSAGGALYRVGPGNLRRAALA